MNESVQGPPPNTLLQRSALCLYAEPWRSGLSNRLIIGKLDQSRANELIAAVG